MSEESGTWRYFVTYSTVKLPLKLVQEIPETELTFRNTYYRSLTDERGLVTKVEKMVRGDVHFTHTYEYDETGAIKRAVVLMDDDESVIDF